MFAKLLVALSSFVLLAAAIPTPGGGSISQCNTGSPQCCQTVQNAQSIPTDSVSNAISVALQGIDAVVGLNCSPITVIGLTSINCAQTPVCCEGNTANGLVNVGCVPISL